MEGVPPRYEVRETLIDDDEQTLQRAYDTLLEREVLLKRAGTAHADRFGLDAKKVLREARALAGIDSPYVQRLLEVIETGNGPVLVLEALAAGRLADRIEAGGRLEDSELRPLAEGLAHALDAIHRHGIVHRNLSTESVLLRPSGAPVLAGFDFAKSSGGGALSSIDYSAKIDRAARPSYPAPEQHSGQSADARSDLYGLGHVLFEAATGERSSGEPLTGDTLACAPKPWHEVLRKLTASSPLGRYPNAPSLLEAIQGRAETVSRSSSKVPWMIAGSLLLLLTAAVAWYFGGRSQVGILDPRFESVRGKPLDSLEPVRGLLPRYSRSFALLVAVTDYGDEFQKLGNAQRDAESIEKQIRRLGWKQIEPLYGHDATRANILAEFGKLEQTLLPNDQFFFYFAGHGMRQARDKSRGWIIPSDAKSFDNDPGRTAWISFEEVGSLLRGRLRAKHVLVALDCCYSGTAIVQQSRMRGNEEQRDASEKYLQRHSKVLLTSAGPDQLASDGAEGSNSPFAAIFIQELKRTTSTRPLLVSQLHAALRIGMKGKQFPVLCRLDGEEKGFGEFMFRMRSDG
ncbi:MAG: caspase family protein [Planctomycetes bacterium]|nr:caspase family protein [Planctomycetota bacterium]